MISSVEMLVERVDDRFDRALHVGLDDQREFHGRRGVVGEHVLEADRRGGGALACRARPGDRSATSRARASFSTTVNGSPADGTAPRPSTSTGNDGPASFTWRPLSSIIARTLPLDAPATNTSPTLQRAALDQHGRQRAAALVELGLDHRAFGGAVGVGLQLEDFGLELDRLEQLVEVGLLDRRDFDVLDVAAHRPRR